MKYTEEKSLEVKLTSNMNILKPFKRAFKIISDAKYVLEEEHFDGKNVVGVK